MSYPADAACRGASDEVFFPSSGRGPVAYRWARMFCDSCPVRAECLADAMEHERNQGIRQMRHGFWGGLSPDERARLAKVSAA